MLTKLKIQNFKQFTDVEIELAERVVFVGPNNSGKTSALQALALWHVGVRRWVEKRGTTDVPRQRAGVTINRRDLIALPIPAANLLWRNLRVREGYSEDGKSKTRNILIKIMVEGIDASAIWSAEIEFDYANEESFYCRSVVGADGVRRPIPEAAGSLKLAYLPPMSGLAANEVRLDDGAIAVRIGEGRTAEVLRNLCWKASESAPAAWKQVVDRMQRLFGVFIDDPIYVRERGEIDLTYRTRDEISLDLSACGRGQQQTLLLLAHLAANPRTILLLDEPDAHLEFLRQRQIYQALTEAAEASGSQIIAASHSEVVLNEAADRDVVVAFIGSPHRIDDRGSQVMKSLKDIGFEHYVQAEQTGWVLYLEGSTDLSILRAVAAKIDHEATGWLSQPFVHYVGNQPSEARKHFFALREAKPDLVGLALFDRLEGAIQENEILIQSMWRRREIENYICQRETLLSYAEAEGLKQGGDLFSASWRSAMSDAIEEIEKALQTLGRDPWNIDTKVSDDFLPALFGNFYQRLSLPNLMSKSDFHALAPHQRPHALDPEFREKLDLIVQIAKSAHPSTQAG